MRSKIVSWHWVRLHKADAVFKLMLVFIMLREIAYITRTDCTKLAVCTSDIIMIPTSYILVILVVSYLVLKIIHFTHWEVKCFPPVEHVVLWRDVWGYPCAWSCTGTGDTASTVVGHIPSGDVSEHPSWYTPYCTLNKHDLQHECNRNTTVKAR